jgi:UDP-N-acetylglucosamine 2-epimerase (non-hydrolysing)/UDP-GlcNAc3NAcA epimerase
MRSFDRRMPEELNRVLTDHLSDLLLCSSQAPADRLRLEQVAGRVEVVGDVMVDVALLVQPRARADAAPLRDAGVTPGEYVLVTAHRAGNVDDPERLRRLVDLLLALPLPAGPAAASAHGAPDWTPRAGSTSSTARRTSA